MSTRRDASAVFAIAVVACLAALFVPALAGATTLPPDFTQTTAIAGLTKPMDVEIAPNGRIFVAEKSGIVKTYDSIADTTATVAADLRTQVHNFSARGLQTLAVDPGFPTKPYIYVYYNLDAKIGGTPPLYGTAGATFDDCAKAPGGKDENCIAAVRVSRLQLAGEVMTGPEKVLVEDYCHQYPFHTGGGTRVRRRRLPVRVGRRRLDRELWDYGQTGTPANPCGDPPGTVGSLLTPPTSEGGRLRVQDLRTPATAGDPTGLDGSLIRIDPATGAGAPDNPLKNSTERERAPHDRIRPARLAAARDPARHQRGVGDRPRRRLLGGVHARAVAVHHGAELRLPVLRGRDRRERQPVHAHPARERRRRT